MTLSISMYLVASMVRDNTALSTACMRLAAIHR